MDYLETPFTYTPKVYGTRFQRNKMAIMFGGVVAMIATLACLALGLLATQEQSELMESFIFLILIAAVSSGIMLFSFIETHNKNKEQLLLDNLHSWGAHSRDKWVYNKLVPYIEKEYNLFLGPCKDFRTLEFEARTEFNETINIKVQGVREKGFSVGLQALNGYEITGEFGIEVKDSSKAL